jgi:sulfate permease, SulP family
VPAIDATGLHALERLAERLRSQGSTLILCDARPQPLALLRRSELRDHLGRANLRLTLESALQRARAILSETAVGPSPALLAE